jgi:hypothetical protein
MARLSQQDLMPLRRFALFRTIHLAKQLSLHVTQLTLS